jgi:nucleoid-associated protein YgaU
VDIRRSSANTPSAPEDTEGVEARSPDLKPAEGSLNLVNPGRAGAPTIERPSAPRIGTASPGLPPEPPSEPPSEPSSEPQSKPESKPETESRPSPAKGSYTIHVVKDGDKLWNLAEKYLGKGHRFGKIIELNKEELGDNPERLRVGLKLKIPKK